MYVMQHVRTYTCRYDNMHTYTRTNTCYCILIYAYIHTCTYTCTYIVNMYVRTYARMQHSVHLYGHVHTYIRTCTCQYKLLYAYVHTRTSYVRLPIAQYVDVQAYIRKYHCTNACTFIYIYMHTYPCTIAMYQLVRTSDLTQMNFRLS